MDNCGFVNEKKDDLGTDIQLKETTTTTTTKPISQVGHFSVGASCACVESDAVCSCSPTPPPKPKVELLNWVKPKGWILLGTGFAFVAWSAIFFTLSALHMI